MDMASTDGPRPEITSNAVSSDLLDFVRDLRSTFLNRTPADPLPAMFFHLDHGIRYNAADVEHSFSPFQIERNLDQAADLLERGLRLRAEWAELGTKELNLRLELEEYIRTTELHYTKEIPAGIHQIASKVNALLALAEETIRQHSSTSFQAFSDARATWFKDSIVADLLNIAWELELASFYNQQGLPKDFFCDCAKRQAAQALGIGGAYAAAQESALLIQKQAAEKRSESAKVQADWDANNATFRKLRSDIARDIGAERAKAADVGGILNYAARRDPLEARLKRDFNEAMARLVAASEGLKKLFGYDSPLPAWRENAYYDECLNWVRNAIAWMVGFARKDQGYVLSLSLRDLLKDDAKWVAGLQHQPSQWDFEIDDTAPFLGDDSQRHVRLRGISVFTVGASGLWRARVRLPIDSYCRHRSGNREDLAQGELPLAYLGRVTDRNSIREPDIVGAASWYNASPFRGAPLGAWRLSIDPMHRTAPSSDLQDIEVDLHLAVQSV